MDPEPCCYGGHCLTSRTMLPLVVVISHSPPAAEAGTLTLPLVLSVMKILPERIVPFTVPLMVAILMAPPSQPSSETPPLTLFAYRLFSAIASVSSMAPAVVLAESSPHRIWERSTLPLVDFAASVSGEAFSMSTLPLMLSACSS